MRLFLKCVVLLHECMFTNYVRTYIRTSTHLDMYIHVFLEELVQHTTLTINSLSLIQSQTYNFLCVRSTVCAQLRIHCSILCTLYVTTCRVEPTLILLFSSWWGDEMLLRRAKFSRLSGFGAYLINEDLVSCNVYTQKCIVLLVQIFICAVSIHGASIYVSGAARKYLAATTALQNSPPRP